MLPLPLLLLAAEPPAPAATGLRCVAALAIVAAEQERGSPGWSDYPLLAARGATWSDLIERESGLSHERYRERVTAEIAALQAQPVEALRAAVDECLPRLDAAVPPPGLIECAAVARLTADALRAREGLSGDAMDLATIASVLDHRARQQLRAEGKSGSESDRLMALAREEVEAGLADYEFGPCLELARP